MEVKATFDKVSSKGTYKRFQIQPNEVGIVGMIYVPVEGTKAKELTLTIKGL